MAHFGSNFFKLSRGFADLEKMLQENTLRVFSYLGKLNAQLYTVSQKTSKIIFVITTSNFHQI